jgi:hypothetical protein
LIWRRRKERGIRGQGYFVQAERVFTCEAVDCELELGIQKWEPPLPTRIGKKRRKGASQSNKLLSVCPTTRGKLKLLKMDRIKDYLLMEEEFVMNQERLKPQEDKNQEERTRVEDLRGT